MAVGKTPLHLHSPFPTVAAVDKLPELWLPGASSRLLLCIPAHPVPPDVTHHCPRCGQRCTQLQSWKAALARQQ